MNCHTRIALIIVAGLAMACGDVDVDNDIKPTGLVLNRTNLVVETGKSFQLEVVFAPTNTTERTLRWTTSNPGIASVSEAGLVSGLSNGSALITATTTNGLSASCAVRVPAWQMVATEVVRAGSLAATALAITPDGKPIVAAALTNSSFAWQWNGSQWTEMVRIPPGESASVLPLWADNFVMTVNATGVPYLACRNLDSSHKASCFSWNGFRWNSVGSPGFSAGGINALDMACDGTGNPAVTFQETISEKTYGTAMRYTGTEWDTIGTPGMHTNAVGYTALAIDPSGVIWAVFTEVAVAPYAATVKRFTGTTWETVGEPGFSATETEFPRIAIAADGNPWVAYRDAANSRVVVKRWDGSAWNTVGDTPFPQTGGNYCNLAFDGDGNAWLASTEMVGDDEKPVVRRWTGSSWQEVAGTTAPDQGAVEYLCLAIAGNGAIFIAYCEEDGSEQVVRVQRFY